MSKKLSKKYEELMKGIITEKRWKKIVFTAYLDATGKTIARGRIVRDPKSTAAGRARAREFFAQYLMGMPVRVDQLEKMNKKDRAKVLHELTDEQLEAIVKQAQDIANDQ